MTHIYFVRHAEPEHDWEDDRTRPLTPEGRKDTEKVTEALKEIPVDVFLSSPYERSVHTIMGSAFGHGMKVLTDERLREREKGKDGNQKGMYQKRWEDLDFHEEGGESIHMVQKRNIEAVQEMLQRYAGRTLVVGTHGTALSSIINFYIPFFDCNDFLRIIDFKPYIIRLDFNGQKYIKQEEILIVPKKFKGKERADR